MTPEKPNEVLILRHDDGVRLASSEEDLRIGGVAKAQVPHGKGNEIETVCQPPREAR